MKEAMVWQEQHWLPCDQKKAEDICRQTEGTKYMDVMKKMEIFCLNNF